MLIVWHIVRKLDERKWKRVLMGLVGYYCILPCLSGCKRMKNYERGWKKMREKKNERGKRGYNRMNENEIEYGGGGGGVVGGG